MKPVRYRRTIRYLADEGGNPLDYRLSAILKMDTVAMAAALFGLDPRQVAMDVLRRRLGNGFADPEQVTRAKAEMEALGRALLNSV